MVIAVLGGSPSPEHDVSLASAEAVSRAILGLGGAVLPVFVAKTGLWHLGEDLHPSNSAYVLKKADSLKRLFTSLGTSREGLSIGKACEILNSRRIQLVFPALHGAYGEGGFVQAHLEGTGIPFVGSGSLSSGLAMSKRKTRLLFRGADLPVARAWHPKPQEAKEMSENDFLQRLDALDFSWPLFLKADHSGSTLGVYKLRNLEEARGKLNSVRNLDSMWIVEEGIQGTEITVGVLGNPEEAVLALPPVEICLRKGDFFDYQSKYDPNAVHEICPAPSLNPRFEAEAKDLAIRAHQVLDCRGFSRTDMILGPKGFILLETNTIPGLTPVSLFPKAGLAAGFSFPHLIQRLCKDALPRNGGEWGRNHSIPRDLESWKEE